MNKISICSIFLVLLSQILSAQVVSNHLVALDDTLLLSYISPLIPLTVSDGPSHGTLSVATPSNGNYQLEYIPNKGYMGLDSIRIILQNDDPIVILPVSKTIAIEVVSATVEAVNDYYLMTSGSSRLLDVVGNDLGSGPITLEVIPLSNNIEAEVIDGEILVTTHDDYEGIANLSYSICVGAEACDVGLISVFVEPIGTNIGNVYLTTKKRVRKKGLLPLFNGYQIVDAPNHGDLENFDAGSFEYDPDPWFVGEDEFTIAYNTDNTTSLKTFHLKVLNTGNPNTFAQPDIFRVAKNGFIYADVRGNDLGDNLLNPFIVEGPEHGTAFSSLGIIKYEPNIGFVGVDHIQYRVCTPAFNCETTNVYFHVGNKVPEFDNYNLNTTLNRSMVINYNVPIDGWEFNVLDVTSAANGMVEYHQGFWAGNVNGEIIKGNNLLIYTPATDYTGQDDFEVEYCLGDDCKVVTIEIDVLDLGSVSDADLCTVDCVWPGDANADGIVNISDLLSLGYCAGEIGPERVNGTTEWLGQPAEEWKGHAVGSNINCKHMDTDGDGEIEEMDKDKVVEFYGLYNNLTSKPESSTANIPIYFVNTTSNPEPGDLVTVDILLGAEATPAIDVTGVTFTLNYNTDVVEEGTFEIIFDNDTWLSYDAPVMDLVMEPVEGKVDAGYTRVSGLMASGYGVIGTASFIIEDDITGIKSGDNLQTILSINNPESMQGNGLVQGLVSEDLTININLDKDKKKASNDDLKVFPNPTNDILNVHLNGKNQFRTVEVIDISGRVLDLDKVEGKHFTKDVSHYQNGLYFVRAVTDDGIFTQRFEVLRGY